MPTEKPQLSRKRNAAFVFLHAVSVTGNLAGGWLNYVIWSDGQIGRGLYDTLVSSAAHMAVALIVAVFGFAATALTYMLSLDPHRLRRPRIRIYLLFLSFGVFLAGYLLGIMRVTADNIPVHLLALALVAALPALVPFAEAYAGRLLIAGARRLLNSGSVAQALAMARSGLCFDPSDPAGEDLVGRALAEAGKFEAAAPYLFESQERGAADLSLIRHLSRLHAARGDHRREAELLEQLYRREPGPRLLEKLVSLWRDLGETDKVIAELEATTGDDRRRWLATVHELRTEQGDAEGLRALAREYETEGPPFARAIECWQQILGMLPDDQAALEQLAELETRRGMAAGAVPHIERLVQLMPQNAAWRRRLIAHYREVDNADGVTRHLEALVDQGQANLREKLETVNDHFSLGDYARVETLVRGDAELAADPRAAYLLAATLFETDHPEAAIAQVKAARALEPDAEIRSALTSIETRAKGQILERELEEFGKKVHAAPDNLDMRFEYLDRLAGTGSADRAVMEFDEVLERDPSLVPRVLSEVDRLLTKYGPSFRLLSYVADIHFRRQDWLRVHETYGRMTGAAMDPDVVLREGAERILHEVPDFAPALLDLARINAKSGDPADALEFLNRYLDGGGQRTDETLRIEFEACRQMGKTRRALEAGEALLAAHPKETGLLVDMARLLENEENFAGAIACLQRARETDHDNAEIRRSIKDLETRRKRQRIGEIATALHETPNDHEILEELGDLHHDFGEWNEAIVAYQRAAHSPTRHDIANAKLGYVLACKGMFAEAQEAFGEAGLRTDQNPDEQKKVKALFYGAGELMEADKQGSLALAIYKRIFRVDAGYRDVVERIDRLQKTEKPKR